MNNSTKTYINRLICLVLMLAWMTIVFMFSNEPADTSQNTSLNTTERIVDTFAGNSVSKEEKMLIVEKLDPLVRKLAHFVLYTLGGVLIANFICTYNFADKKKLLYSICIGVAYACTDEFHQLFVEGRGALITDVLIDSLGIAIGACVFMCITKITYILKNHVSIYSNDNKK